MNRFRFIKVREVVSPNRANPNDAGLDFYVPTNLTLEDIHSKNGFDSGGYDLDILEDTVGIKKYIRGLIRKGKDRKEVITKTVEKFEVPRKRIRELYKECTK